MSSLIGANLYISKRCNFRHWSGVLLVLFGGWSSGRVTQQRVVSRLATPFPSVLFPSSNPNSSTSVIHLICSEIGPHPGVKGGGGGLTYVSVLGSVVGEHGDGETPEKDETRFRRCQSEPLVHGRMLNRRQASHAVKGVTSSGSGVQ